MITISCRDTLYTYNLYHLVKAFFPEQEVKQELHAEQGSLATLTLNEGTCFSVVEDAKGKLSVQYTQLAEPLSEQERKQRSGEEIEKETEKAEGSVTQRGGMQPEKGRKDPQERKRQVTRLVYEQLSACTGQRLAWGMLTGVRPTKLVMGKLEQGCNEENAAQWMQEEYGVTEQKARLAVQIAAREKQLLHPFHLQKGYSLYVGIPFCPSICSYCSFSSSPVAVWEDRMDEYVDALCREISALGFMVNGRTPDTIYLGGGTPTTLHPEQLERLLSQIERSFLGEGDASVLEYTVEAGRPDSITREKLEVLRAHPVTRISVNPQTMQQKTLDRVGRRHRVEDVKSSFSLARSLGFDNINMDLIAGLPGETARDMEDTLRQVEELGPDSLTVHSLAMKRAARMGQEFRAVRSQNARTGHCLERESLRAGNKEVCFYSDGTEEEVRKETADILGTDLQKELSQMIEDSAAAARRMEMEPYYLYRQKNIAGNFENVGYAKAGKAGIYNILIMEEKQTILAAGAGAMTKLVLPEVIRTKNGKKASLIRMENVKNIAEYMNRVEEIVQRKRKLVIDFQEKSGAL